MSRTFATILTTVSLAAAAASVAGCGDSSPLPVGVLIARADPICARGNAELTTVTKAANRSELPGLAQAAAGYERRVADELSRLEPPSKLAADWRTIVQNYRTLSVYSVLLEKVLREGRRYDFVFADYTNSQQARVLAALRHGFKQCGEYGGF